MFLSNPQGAGDLLDVVERDISGSAFDMGDERPVQHALQGKILLGQSPAGAQCLHVRREDVERAASYR